MRIAVLHPQTSFVRGGAETHTESVVRALREAGHEAELVTIAGKWYPAEELAHQMAVWRSFDISESNGLHVDAAIALKFPAYLAPHEHKIVWLIHQHRTAYELYDHPAFGDLAKQEAGPGIRDLIHRADEIALREAAKIFTNSRNVKDRLWSSLHIPAEVLYPPSPVAEALLTQQPGGYGDHILFPSRFEGLKRQSLAIEAMRHVSSDARLILVGKGPDEEQLRTQVRELGVEDKVRFEIAAPDARLYELYRTALGVFYGPFDEDYGYVTIEAMAAERPVVTVTDAGGPLEFVEDGETGFVTDPKPRAIAEAFDRLWADRDRARRMGTAGHALVRETVPTWPEVVARLLD
jgi:glycosyltransferase involved in cell wall biosynthesis